MKKSWDGLLVSQSDTYLANLVRALYRVRPDILNCHAKTITYQELVRLGSVESVELALIESEIESLLRGSHTEQFKWLESRFDIRLRETDDKWAQLIELTERRNLFVHANARVSSQYLKVCKQNKVHLEADCRLGSQLSASSKYFQAACSILK